MEERQMVPEGSNPQFDALCANTPHHAAMVLKEEECCVPILHVLNRLGIEIKEKQVCIPERVSGVQYASE